MTAVEKVGMCNGPLESREILSKVDDEESIWLANREGPMVPILGVKPVCPFVVLLV